MMKDSTEGGEGRGEKGEREKSGEGIYFPLCHFNSHKTRGKVTYF